MAAEALTRTADVLAIYTRDVARIPMLTPAQEREVGARALAGDKEAQDQLVTANLRFVIKVAKNYQHHNVPLMDLIEAGNLGLMHAARKFDPSMGVKFISYAVFWIQQSIGKEVKAASSVVAATPTQLVRLHRIRRLQAEARQKLGREYTVAELREITKYTVDRIEEALNYRVTIKSLDEPVGASDGSSTTTLAQMIGAEDDREEREHQEEVASRVARVLGAVLSEREQKILRMYFGIGGGRSMSLTDIGEIEGISRERARQLKERALRKLKAAAAHHPDLLEVFTTAQHLEERAAGRSTATARVLDMEDTDEEDGGDEMACDADLPVDEPTGPVCAAAVMPTPAIAADDVDNPLAGLPALSAAAADETLELGLVCPPSRPRGPATMLHLLPSTREGAPAQSVATPTVQTDLFDSM